MKIFSEMVLSKNHLIAIGNIAASWSYSEVHLELLIWQLMGIDSDRGNCVTTHLQSETKIHILESLAKKRLPIAGLKIEITQCVADIRRLRAERNNIVHGIWISKKFPKKMDQRGKKATPQIAKVTAKGEVKMTQTPWTAKKIMAIAVEIDNLNMRLVSLRIKINEDADRRQALSAALLAHPRIDRNPYPTTTKSTLLRDIGKK